MAPASEVFAAGDSSQPGSTPTANPATTSHVADSRDAICFTPGLAAAVFGAGAIHAYLASNRKPPLIAAGISLGAVSAAAMQRSYAELEPAQVQALREADAQSLEGVARDRFITARSRPARWNWFRNYLHFLSHRLPAVLWNSLPDQSDFFADMLPVKDPAPVRQAGANEQDVRRREMQSRRALYLFVKLGRWLSRSQVNLRVLANTLVSMVRAKENYPGLRSVRRLKYLAVLGYLSLRVWAQVLAMPHWFPEHRFNPEVEDETNPLLKAWRKSKLFSIRPADKSQTLWQSAKEFFARLWSIPGKLRELLKEVLSKGGMGILRTLAAGLRRELRRAWRDNFIYERHGWRPMYGWAVWLACLVVPLLAIGSISATFSARLDPAGSNLNVDFIRMLAFLSALVGVVLYGPSRRQVRRFSFALAAVLLTLTLWGYLWRVVTEAFLKTPQFAPRYLLAVLAFASYVWTRGRLPKIVWQVAKGLLGATAVVWAATAWQFFTDTWKALNRFLPGLSWEKVIGAIDQSFPLFVRLAISALLLLMLVRSLQGFLPCWALKGLDMNRGLLNDFHLRLALDQLFHVPGHVATVGEPLPGSPATVQLITVTAPLQTLRGFGEDGLGSSPKVRQLWARANTPIVEALRASLAAPGLFAPVHVRGADLAQWLAGDPNSFPAHLDLVDGSVIRQNPIPAFFSYLRRDATAKSASTEEQSEVAALASQLVDTNARPRLHIVYGVPVEPRSRQHKTELNIVEVVAASLSLSRRRDTRMEVRQTQEISAIQLEVLKAASGTSAETTYPFGVFPAEVAPEVPVRLAGLIDPAKNDLLAEVAHGCRRTLEVIYAEELVQIFGRTGASHVACADLLSRNGSLASGLPEVCSQCSRSLCATKGQVASPYQTEPSFETLRKNPIEKRFPMLTRQAGPRIVFVASGGGVPRPLPRGDVGSAPRHANPPAPHRGGLCRNDHGFGLRRHIERGHLCEGQGIVAEPHRYLPRRGRPRRFYTEA